MTTGPDTTAAGRLADALIRHALQAVGGADGRAADPLAGLRVTDDDVVRLLAQAGSPLGRPDAAVTRARADLHHALDPDEPLARLARCCRLVPVEVEVLAVLTAVAADPRRARLLAYLNDDVARRAATPAALSLLFGGDAAAPLATQPGGGLDRAGLLVRDDDSLCWGDAPVLPHPSVLWWLCSGGQPPPLPPGAASEPASAVGTHRRVVVSGADRTRRLEAVRSGLAADRLLVAPPSSGPEGWGELVRWASLADAALVLEVASELPAEAREQLERAEHLCWAVSSDSDVPVAQLPRRGWYALVAAPPAATRAERAAVLADPEAIGDQLTADQLAAVRDLLPAVGGDVELAVRRLAAGRLERLADRIVPTRGWDDLVLPERQRGLVRHVVTRARHRDRVYDDWGFSPQPSRGVVAMFSGPSGTGKTLAAEVVAGEIGLDLYRVDLSRMVDKYIGETEKNLSEAFDAAGASPVVLFFDEADALLGKRSAVSSSHDRYANLEVAFLLQRLERYDGVVVLASNLPQNLDPAFTRRLHVHVQFPMPGPEERRRIWRRSVPPGAPQDDVDLDLFADRFELSGGAIRNAAQSAAFLAAEAGTGLTMEVLGAAVRHELAKDARRIREEDFAVELPVGG